jgi:undecaprenyl-diphosphatase
MLAARLSSMSEADVTGTPVRSALTANWSTVGALAIAFVFVALASRGPNTLEIDLRVSTWVQRWNGPFGENLAVVGNALGYSTAAVVLLAIAWVGLALLRRRQELWFVAFLVIGRLTATGLKELLDSPRPASDQVIVVGRFDEWGYPSGHVTTAAVTLGAIAWITQRFLPDSNVRMPLLIAWLFGVAIAAWARIWYGAHWFTDTVGGALVGAVIVLTAANLSALVTSRRARVKQPAPTRTPAP